MEVLGDIACGGESHRLLVTDDGLRLLDHEHEEAKVFDVLTGGSECTQMAAAWQRLLDRHVGSAREDKLYLGIVETLMPDREFPDWYEDHLRMISQHPGRVGASSTPLLLTLPEPLRCALALQFVERTLDAGGIRDAARAARLRESVGECWDSFAAQGEPSPSARRRLVWDIRPHRWPATHRPELQP